MINLDVLKVKDPENNIFITILPVPVCVRPLCIIEKYMKWCLELNQISYICFWESTSGSSRIQRYSAKGRYCIYRFCSIFNIVTSEGIRIVKLNFVYMFLSVYVSSNWKWGYFPRKGSCIEISVQFYLFYLVVKNNLRIFFRNFIIRFNKSGRSLCKILEKVDLKAPCDSKYSALLLS